VKIKIGIASYGQFSQYIDEVEKGLPEDVELVILNDLFSELETTIRRIEANRSVDVFVSAGGNAEFLEKYLREIPLVKIQLTGFDVLNALKEAKACSDHVAVITRSPVEELDTLLGIVNMEVEVIAYHEVDDLDAILETLYAKGVRDVIGSSYVIERAKFFGIRGHFIWSQKSVQMPMAGPTITAGKCGVP